MVEWSLNSKKRIENEGRCIPYFGFVSQRKTTKRVSKLKGKHRPKREVNIL